MKGSYILLIELNKDEIIQVGRLGKLSFKKGNYVYVGSALNGLEQRINRHLRSEKKMHWHIDYLLKYAKIIDVFYKESFEKEECNLSKKLEDALLPILGFGCTDCKCKSHLYCTSNKDINKIINKLNVKNYSF